MLEWIDSWGARLTFAAVVYSMVAMMVSWSFASAGLQPPPLVPSVLMDIYSRSLEAWSSVSGVVASGNIAMVILQLMFVIGSSLLTILALLASVALTYVWVAVLVTQALPPPLNILTPMVWAAAVLANTIVALYMLKRVYDVLQMIRAALPVT